MMSLNQQQTQQSGRIMPEPPPVLSTKDSLYLTDALSWELTSFKMLNQAAQNCNDPEISDYLHRAGQMHQTHYQTLLTHLHPSNKANM